MTKNRPLKSVVKGICHNCNNDRLWTPQVHITFKCTKCKNTQENLK